MKRTQYWAVVMDACEDPQAIEDLFLGRETEDDNLSRYIYLEAKSSLEDSSDQDEAIPELAYRLMWAKGQLDGVIARLMVAVEGQKESGRGRAA